MEIIKFSNGQYGVRKRGVFWWKYKSMNTAAWHTDPEIVAQYCVGSREDAQKQIDTLSVRPLTRSKVANTEPGVEK